MPTCEPFHEDAQVRGIIERIDEEVDVVVHEAIRVHAKAKHGAAFAESPEVIDAIAVAEEHRVASVTSLNQVMR